MIETIKGRGAQINTHNKFLKHTREVFWDDANFDPDVLSENNQTNFTKIHPKTILNKVDSPDVPADWSMNPYQGCEHGCVYCYARITHEYWGYSAGKDFEREIMIKENAADLLDKKLSGKNWKATPIMLSGNTDCYQPAERTFKLTRKLLEICLKHKHPVGIITKNSLVCRDLDILSELAKEDLVHIHVSITTLDEKLRRLLEPRTSSTHNRLKTVKTLIDNKIPTSVMMAPIIPGLNSDEIFELAEAIAQTGCTSLGHTMVRLNGAIALLFEDWIQKQMPLKANRVLNLIAEAQGGKLGNSAFGERMSGTGVLAESINQQVRLAKKKYHLNQPLPNYNTQLFRSAQQIQLNLF